MCLKYIFHPNVQLYTKNTVFNVPLYLKNIFNIFNISSI